MACRRNRLGPAKGAVSLESLKLLFEVENSTTMPARFKDFPFPANMPRIFSSNAKNPHTFHSALPVDPWSLSDEQRTRLDCDVKAAFKRSCFAMATRLMVPGDARGLRQKTRRVGDVDNQ